MPEPTLLSPSTGNYQVGKGVVSFKKTGSPDYRDLGNVSSLVITPDLTTLDHFSSRTGTKSKDLSIVLEKKLTLKMTMDEVTAFNLSIMSLGTVDEAAIDGPTIDLFTENAVTGALKFVGTNDVGAKVNLDLYNVSFTPTGDIGFISDEFNELEAEADVLVSDQAPNVGKFGMIQLTDVGSGS